MESAGSIKVERRRFTKEVTTRCSQVAATRFTQVVTTRFTQVVATRCYQVAATRCSQPRQLLPWNGDTQLGPSRAGRNMRWVLGKLCFKAIF